MRVCLLTLMIAVPAATVLSAQAPFGCVVAAGVPPLVRAEGRVELAGDLVLHCTGGTAGAQRTIDLSVDLNAPAPVPAILLVNEPQPQTQVVGENVFQGTGTTFTGVKYTEPGASGATTLRITNIRADASSLGVSGTLVPSQVVAMVRVTSVPTVALVNPNQVIGMVSQGLYTLVRSADDTTTTSVVLQQCQAMNPGLPSSFIPAPAATAFHLRFTEGFGSAFKPRTEAAAGAVPSAQAVPGGAYYTESGFYNPALTQLSSSGLASHGTRMMARFTGIPAGVSIYVPTVWRIPRTLNTTAGLGRAILTSTDANGAGAYNPVTSLIEAQVNGVATSVAALPVSGGNATAVWGIDSVWAFEVEALSMPVLLSYAANAPALGTANVALSFAPVLSPTSVPNFADVPNHQRAFSVVSCATAPPDLEVSSVSVPWTISAGSAFDAVVTVRNSGAGAAEASQLEAAFYRDPEMTQMVAGTRQTCDVGALAAGASAACTRSFAAPAPAGSGGATFYLGARADAGGVLTESSTANNRRSQPMLVTPCVFSFTPASQDAGTGGGSFSAAVTAAAACTTFAASHASWVSLATFSRTGSGPIGYTVAQNTGAPRKTAILIGDRRLTINQAGAAGCPVTLSAGSRSYTAAGASSESVTVSSSCPWSASTDASWITVNLTSGAGGSITLLYNVLTNTGPARSGRIYVADQELLITQTGGNTPPSIAITSPTSASTYSSFTPVVTLAGTATDLGGVPTAVYWSTSQGLAGAASGTTNWTATIPLGPGSNVVSVFALDAAGDTSIDTVDVTYTPVVAGEALRFVPVSPCRVADTRNPAGPLGSPHMGADSTRSFPVPSSNCGVPATARAYSLNVTVVPRGMLGYISLWPAGRAKPWVSTLNSLDGRIKANAAIVPAGVNGAVSVYAQHATDVILDINGYFVAATDAAALAFYPLTPCRVVDTREAARGVLGAPVMAADQKRTFPVLSSGCAIPASARAYSLNFTVVPRGYFGYLSTWPTGAAQPWVSTLNALTGTITANAAIVPAGNGGAIDVYAQHATDVIVDVNGYFAPAGAGGLSLYNVTPCRVFDTRDASGAPRLNGARDVGVSASACGIPVTARAFAMNATVVPPGFLGYISLWPQGATQPLVSTLNAIDAAITSNMAIVPTSNGSVSAYSAHPTELILDVSGYFAP